MEMEGRKHGGSSSPSASSSSTTPSSSPPSSSSLASELFGSKETHPSSSSTGIFSSIFAPPPKVLGKESVRYESERKQDFQNEPWRSESGPAGETSNFSEGGGQSMWNRDTGTIYQEQRVQPCHLSSSIFYGGQENYSHPSSTQGSGLNPALKKDAGEDDGRASRGNWWQGSLYY